MLQTAVKNLDAGKSGSFCEQCGRFVNFILLEDGGVYCDCPVRYEDSTCHPVSPFRKLDNRGASGIKG